MRLVHLGPVPTPERAHGNLGGVGAFLNGPSPIQIAGGSNCTALLKRIEIRLLFELLHKRLTPSLQQFHVRLTILFYFFLELVHATLLTVPFFKFLLFLCLHTIGVIVQHGRDTPHIALVLGGIETMRKVPLLHFFELKGRRKGAQREGEETQTVLEGQRPTGEAQDFSPHTKLALHTPTVFIQTVQHEHPVKAL